MLSPPCEHLANCFQTPIVHGDTRSGDEKFRLGWQDDAYNFFCITLDNLVSTTHTSNRTLHNQQLLAFETRQEQLDRQQRPLNHGLQPLAQEANARYRNHLENGYKSPVYEPFGIQLTKESVCKNDKRVRRTFEHSTDLILKLPEHPSRALALHDLLDKHFRYRMTPDSRVSAISACQMDFHEFCLQQWCRLTRLPKLLLLRFDRGQERGKHEHMNMAHVNIPEFLDMVCNYKIDEGSPSLIMAAAGSLRGRSSSSLRKVSWRAPRSREQISLPFGGCMRISRLR